MCRSTSISGRSGRRRRSAGSPSRRVPARGQLARRCASNAPAALPSSLHQAVVGRGSGGPSARPSPASWPCGRPGARRSSPRSGGPAASRAALGGGVKRADVERARVAQGGVGGAGRERLVHVHEVELDAAQQFLHRARHVDRQRRRAPACRARPRRAPRPPRSLAACRRRSPPAGSADRSAPRAAPCAMRARAPASATAPAPARGGRAATARRRRAARAR